MILSILFECLIISNHRIPLHKLQSFLSKFIDSRLLFILNVHGFVYREILSVFHLSFDAVCTHSVVAINLVWKQA